MIQAGGEPLGATPVYVPPLPPGHSTTVTLKLIAPNKPGTHRGYFHLVTDKGDQIGGKFERNTLLIYCLDYVHLFFLAQFPLFLVMKFYFSSRHHFRTWNCTFTKETMLKLDKQEQAVV